MTLQKAARTNEKEITKSVTATTAAATNEQRRAVFAAAAHQYALDVTSKKVPAGKWVRKAAQRHLDDLKRSQSDPKYPYVFNASLGARACLFVSMLPHTKGKWAAHKELIKLQPWQCFLLCVLFGWVIRDGPKKGKRRFRAVYWEIPRKNGKSILAAAIGLYMFLADNEYGAEVYSGATSEKQAWEVFMPAKLMLDKSPAIKLKFDAEVRAKMLFSVRTGSKFEPVIGNPGDGPSPSCAIVDEYHEHMLPVLHDTMETGMGAREQPLMLVITTAGYNLASPCYAKHEEVCKMLDGIIENDQLFGCIFSIDSDEEDAKDNDDWANPSSLIKANPNYDVSVDGDFLRAQQRQAMVNPVEQNKFKTKHLNVWCSVYNSLFNLQSWKMATDTMLDEDELIDDPGVESFIAIDLASKLDLCTEQRMFRKIIDEKPHYYLFGRYWLPEETIEEPGPNNAHYKKWVKMGLLTPTEGAVIDFGMITAQVVEDAKRINPKEVIYDPFNAAQMSQTLTAEGVKTVVEFIQQPSNFAVPIDEFTAALKDGRFHHDGNEITAWCISNVVARPAKKGMFSPVKAKAHQKIDGAVAAIMCMARACATAEKEKQYQTIVL